MKIRNGFVSNSSSTSFSVILKEVDYQKIIKALGILNNSFNKIKDEDFKNHLLSFKPGEVYKALHQFGDVDTFLGHKVRHINYISGDDGDDESYLCEMFLSYLPNFKGEIDMIYNEESC